MARKSRYPLNKRARCVNAPPKRKAPAGYGTEAGAGISVAAEIRSPKYNETENSASVKAIVQADDIQTFRPGISEDEYVLRAKIRSKPNGRGNNLSTVRGCLISRRLGILAIRSTLQVSF